MLAAGAIPPNPAELLQSAAMKVLLDKLRGQFDVVLIDAPPLLPVTDAAILGSASDGAILVVRHGKTTRDQVTAAIGRLHSVDARLLGTVINMTPAKRSAYGYGYSYGSPPRLRAGELVGQALEKGTRKLTDRRGSPGSRERRKQAKLLKKQQRAAQSVSGVSAHWIRSSRLTYRRPESGWPWQGALQVTPTEFKIRVQWPARLE